MSVWFDRNINRFRSSRIKISGTDKRNFIGQVPFSKIAHEALLNNDEVLHLSRSSNQPAVIKHETASLNVKIPIARNVLRLHDLDVAIRGAETHFFVFEDK